MDEAGAWDDEDDDEDEDDEDDQFAMRFTVIGRAGGLVHVVSEGGGEVFVHPAVEADVWAAVRDRAPAAWEIVEVPEGRVPDGPQSRVPYSDADLGHDLGHDEDDDDAVGDSTRRQFAEMQYGIFHSFVEAGFERPEAMRLLITLMASDLDRDDD